MQSIFFRLLALGYAAVMGICLYMGIPRALLFADAQAAFWVLPVTLVCLLLTAVAASLPLRILLRLSGKSCGKFYAVCCAALMGFFVTYELCHYLSEAFFSGPVAGGAYVLFGGIVMMTCPIAMMYRYVS